MYVVAVRVRRWLAGELWEGWFSSMPYSDPKLHPYTSGEMLEKIVKEISTLNKGDMRPFSVDVYFPVKHSFCWNMLSILFGNDYTVKACGKWQILHTEGITNGK